MKLQIYYVDVFISEFFCGNFVGVVLYVDMLSDVQMQLIVYEFCYLEIVFLLKSEESDVCICYFILIVEVFICGYVIVVVYYVWVMVLGLGNIIVW